MNEHKLKEQNEFLRSLIKSLNDIEKGRVREFKFSRKKK